MIQPELADALLDTDFILFFVMVTKFDMVEFLLDTWKILNSVESGNQKNGKTKSDGRNGWRRQQTIHVHTSMRKPTRTNIVSTVAQVALSSRMSLQSCAFISRVFF